MKRIACALFLVAAALPWPGGAHPRSGPAVAADDKADPADQKPRARLEQAGEAWSLAFSPDSKTLASGGGDATVKLWDVATGKEVATLKGPRGTVVALAFSPDGKTLASGAMTDPEVRLWDVATGKEIASAGGHSSAVLSVAFSPDGKTLVTGGHDGAIILRDAATGKEKGTFKGRPKRDALTGKVNPNAEPTRARCLAFSPDSTMLVSAGDRPILWEVEGAREKLTFEGHGIGRVRGPVWGAAFSPDGKTVATAAWDTTVRLWDATTGAQKAKYEGHKTPVRWVAFSPDGKTVVSAGDSSSDTSVRLWDVATSKEKAVLSGHTDRLGYVAFSPDGKTVASGSWDKTIALWDVTPEK